jgi:hypothetical protein
VRSSNQWLRFSLLPLLVTLAFTALAVTAMADSSTASAWAQDGGTAPSGTMPKPAVVYLGFKTSDEIEFDQDNKEDFRYKNEDIVAFALNASDPNSGTFSIYFDGSECGLAEANLDDFEILDGGKLIFTLRSKFTIEGLGEVDDSDVISYTSASGTESCGTFGYYARGAALGLTKGEEDIDALGLAEDGSLVVSTIGTANVMGSTGEFKAKDQDLIKLNKAAGTWSLYFDGSDVELTKGSEDIRSVWLDAFNTTEQIQNIYLTISGKFNVESNNEDKGDKNDLEGCSLLQSGDTTKCFFHKLLDGEEIGAENQLDGLAVEFGSARAPITAIGSAEGATNEEVAEAASDAADFAEARAEGDSEVTIDDFMDVATTIYLPLVEQ